MIEFLSDIDTQLLLFFNGIHSPFWDYFMSAFTGKVIWVPMYASILYILLKNFHWKVALCYVVAIALTITFADQMCNSFLRPLVGRLRPSNPENPIADLGMEDEEEDSVSLPVMLPILSDLPYF